MSSLDTNRVQFEAALKALLEGLGSGVITGGTILPSRLSIINYVKAKLDEIIPEGEGVIFNLSEATNISNPLDLLINAHLDESTKDVILSAPLTVLFPKGASISSVNQYPDNKTGFVILPADFLRLSFFKMSDWKRGVTIPITPQDPKYKKQSISFRRGTPSAPVAVMTWTDVAGTSKRILEYYSIDTSHSVDKLFYIPETVAEDFVVVNPNLLDSLAWMCAGKIMQITSQSENFKLAMAQVQQSYLNL